MSTLNIAGTATDSAGQVLSYTGTINVTPPALVVNSVVVTPDPAPPGTMRTITINVSGGTPPYTFTCVVNGVTASPTAQPNVFTFVA